jgi:hypothetical protein
MYSRLFDTARVETAVSGLFQNMVAQATMFFCAPIRRRHPSALGSMAARFFALL